MSGKNPKIKVMKVKTDKSAKQLAKEALKKVNSLSRAEETKYFVASYNNGGGTITDNANSPYWEQFNMNQIAGGSAYNQRIGNKIEIQELFVDVLLQFGGNADGGQMTRIVIVQDRQTDPDSSIAIAELFQNPSSNFNSLIAYNQSAQSRFKIIHDKVYNCDPVGIATFNVDGDTTTDVLLNTQKHFRLRFFGKHLIKNLYYNGVNSGDFDKNALYLLITRLNTSANGATVVPTINWVIKYKDA